MHSMPLMPMEMLNGLLTTNTKKRRETNMSNNKYYRELIIEDAPLMFRNFSGKPGKFNKEGDRNFCVKIDTELADELAGEGWNVKQLTPRSQDDDPVPYLQIKVNYNGPRPPKVYMIVNGQKTLLDADTVNTIDFADIKQADLVISSSNWEVQGKCGVAGYLKTAYITLNIDALAEKYMDIPDSAVGKSNIPTDDEYPWE